MAYATVDDLTERWRELSESEKKKAAVLLDDAAAFLDAELARRGLTTEGLQRALKVVSCNMVKRAMAVPYEGDYTSISRTVGSFTEQYSPRNPYGDMYLSAADKRLLGIDAGRGRIAQVFPC